MDYELIHKNPVFQSFTMPCPSYSITHFQCRHESVWLPQPFFLHSPQRIGQQARWMSCHFSTQGCQRETRIPDVDFGIESRLASHSSKFP